jgi:N-acetylglucosamine malate deacetylase 2
MRLAQQSVRRFPQIAPASDQGHDVLSLLADPARTPLAAQDVAVVVAHPDDETVGCGAKLRRLVGATVILLTDGAPRKLSAAQEHDCTSVDDYRALRSREVCKALSLANIAKRNIVELGFSDQTAALRLVEVTRAVYCLIEARGIATVLTHAYEGGHPDHDAAAFAVHATAEIKGRNGERLSIIEMPLYRADNDNKWCLQSFVDDQTQPAVVIPLSKSEQCLKRRMVAAHQTQRQTLSPFRIDREVYRAAPRYDFRSLPNRGLLLYERYDWGMTGARWLHLVERALRELGLRDPPWA